VPAQDRGRSDQAVTAQVRGEVPDQRSEQRSVGPVRAWPRVGYSQHGDLVAQREQLDVLGRGCAAKQGQPTEELAEDQVEQAKRHDHDRAGAWGYADRRRSRPQADFWNPTGAGRSSAAAATTCRARRPDHAGRTAVANFAPRAAKRRSHINARTKPSPAHAPLIAAMTGFGISVSAVHALPQRRHPLGGHAVPACVRDL
jgi:hypothetical protein